MLVVTTVSQELYLKAGDYLSGSAAFYNYNGFYGGDTAWVKIYNGGTEIANPWDAYSGSFFGGDPLGHASGYGSLQYQRGSPWITWNWTAPTDGFYTLELAQQSLANGGTGTISSYVAFDNMTVVTVPEPSTFALVGLGVAALIIPRRRK